MRKMIGLEALEKMKNYEIELGYNYDKNWRVVSCNCSYMYEVYSDEFKIIENELKALEIINNKRIDVDWFKECNSYTAYNKSRLIYSKITQEEYELVNKVLNKEE